MALKKTQNVKLGICSFIYDGTDMGYTRGGVEVSITTETRRTEVDNFGTTDVTELIAARRLTITTALAETTLRNLIATMPGSTLISNGSSASGNVTWPAGDPLVAHSVTINGFRFAFTDVSGGLGLEGQVPLGANKLASLKNLAEAVQLQALRQDLGGLRAAVNPAGTGIVISVADAGTAGNAVTLSSVGGTASGATLTGGADETDASVIATTGVGINLAQIAKPLRLRPIGSTDARDDFLAYAAATSGNMKFAYKLDDERVFNVEFATYPDRETGRLFAAGTLSMPVRVEVFKSAVINGVETFGFAV